MQGNGAQQLHVEMTHPENPLAALADHGKRLGQQIVQRSAIDVALTKLCGFCSQLLIGQGRHAGFKRIDLRHLLAILLKDAVVTTTNELFSQRNHSLSSMRTCRVSRNFPSGSVWVCGRSEEPRVGKEGVGKCRA